jgi:GNAT superfamily N-acetyltransferase
MRAAFKASESWRMIETILLPLIFTAVVATMGALMARAWRWYLDHRISTKHRLTGWYASTFQNRLRGTDEFKRDKAFIHVQNQRGRRFKGDSYALGRDRGWLLEGELSKSGHLVGEYGTRATTDASRGAFFLQDGGFGEFEGGWIGYTRNRLIEFGGYTWCRMPFVEIRPAARSETKTIASMVAVEGFGVPNMATEGTEFFVAVHVSDISGVVALEYSGVDNEAVAEEPWCCTDELRERLQGSAITVVRTLVTAASYRNMGIATRLLLYSISQARTVGSDLILIPSVEPSLASLLEAVGFEELGGTRPTAYAAVAKTLPMPWLAK